MRGWVLSSLATVFWKQREEIKRLNKALSQAEQTIFELEDDRDLMIRKFNEDLENAVAFYAKK